MKDVSREDRIERLRTLKTIAETLNECQHLKQMLQAVLVALLQVTKFEAGWIYLFHEKKQYELIASHNVPPGLSWKDNKPLCHGGCWCHDQFRNGKIEKAINIIECQRIENAIMQKWGDTKGITHHATVPLQAGEEQFGLLNISSPHQDWFSDEELALLEAVALQIGTAIKRVKLYEAEQKRAELYEKLGKVSVAINSSHEEQIQLKDFLTKEIQSVFGWKEVVIELGEKNERELENQFKALFSVGKTKGVLLVKHNHLDDIDQMIIQELANHAAIAIENDRIAMETKEITVLQERNRLARDLHDSVNQLLFSLSLTAKGVAKKIEDPKLQPSFQYIQELSQEALKEMRALIWQLRPSGLENGLVSALQSYAFLQQLTMEVEIKGLVDLPSSVEECLWRVGQESINNCKKHANTNKLFFTVEMKESQVYVTIEDYGRGFDSTLIQSGSAFGLTGMKERVETIGGTMTIKSELNKGTTIEIILPIQ
ncbi:GAF domain-containing sensor histidine kinase [Alkalihalobacterium bogoriense]|uniref:GAF domain-containing sensor histidine kinase n=1 Tax=Alkalihalobacterium bogoriense TaxID=246272 RepID=UPI00047C4594|nr:GAF domain-containing sensor histidine kinase [Alkalihalobacterium bogoriense]